MHTIQTSKLQHSKNNNPHKLMLIIEIECCYNCSSHSQVVHHHEQKYQFYYDLIRKKLKQNHIQVKRKLPPNYYIKKSPYCPQTIYSIQNTNQTVFFPAVGAFEVYFNDRKIFSKLQSLAWPNPDHLISQIYKQTILDRNKQQQPKVQRVSRFEQVLAIQSQKNSLQYQMYQKSKKRYLKLKEKIQNNTKNQTISVSNTNIQNMQQLRPETTLTGRYNRNQHQSYEKQIVKRYIHTRSSKSRQSNHRQIRSKSQKRKDGQNQEQLTIKNINIRVSRNKSSQKSKIQKYLHNQLQMYLNPIVKKEGTSKEKYQKQKQVLDQKLKELQKIRTKNHKDQDQIRVFDIDQLQKNDQALKKQSNFMKKIYGRNIGERKIKFNSMKEQ